MPLGSSGAGRSPAYVLAFLALGFQLKALAAAAPACATSGSALLQKFTSRGRVLLEDGSSEAVHERSQNVATNGAARGRMRLSVLQRHGEASASMIGRTRGHAAFSAYMWQKMDALNASQNISNTELDGLITSFINAHTVSADSCPPKLMEAKHQLNQLHQEILNLADLINNTQSEVERLEKKLKDTQDDIRREDEICKNKTKDLEEEKEEALRMLLKLRLEMAEMRAIAQPEVTMNLTNRSIKTSGGALSLLQGEAMHSKGIPMARALEAMSLVRKAKDAAKTVLSCLASLRDRQRNPILLATRSSLVTVPKPGDCSANSTTAVTVANITTAVKTPVLMRNRTYRSFSCNKVDERFGGSIWLHCLKSVLSADGRGCIQLPNTIECKLQKEDLEAKYTKAYVELSRLIAEYEEIHSSTDPEDALKKECKLKKDPLEETQGDTMKKLKKTLQHLQDLRPKLEDMLAAERKLRKHIAELTTSCSQLDATGRGLDSVRDAIHALEACPGLYRAEFHIPLWTGKWATFMLNNTRTDQANDAAMKTACESMFGDGVRAAEVSEIEGGFIEGMPRNNTASLLLIGTCPKCNGKPDSETGLSNAEGHARICWDVGKPLNRASRREDCSNHLKAIACVQDRGDIRKNDWSAYRSVCPGTSTSFSQAETNQMLEIHNKMRCTVGASPLIWNRALQCQAQEWADKCKFEHSDLVKSPIKASENLATGTNVDTAAWMWYTEYTKENPARSINVGHFTAMVWNASTQLGCGICRNGTGVVVCQYANASGNILGMYDGNVPSYAGFAADYQKCGLSVKTAKENIKQFEGWGVLTPQPSIVANLG